MKALIIVGIVFIVLGSITLMFGGFPISSKTKSIDIGPIETTIMHSGPNFKRHHRIDELVDNNSLEEPWGGIGVVHV